MSEHLKMVIVDDEPRVTQSLEREIALEFGTELFAITCFNSSIASLPYITYHQDNIFLVISDLRMPEMNGSDLLERIRSDCPDIQTILLTAYTDIDNIQKAVASSIQSLLFKPWTRESIVTEVDKALKIWKLKRENKALSKRISDMLRDTGEFQQKLFAQTLPVSAQVRFSVSFKPYEKYHCGGDFYAMFDAGAGKHLIVLGDATGHGPKSAMIAGILKTTLQWIIDADPTLLAAPDRLLKKINDHFCKLFSASPETLIALSAVFIDTAGRFMGLATAGLPPVIHVRGGKPELLRTPNMILGASAETSFYKMERFLLPGDHILLFTDGLVESVPSFFSHPPEAVAAAFSDQADYSAEAVAEAFRQRLPGQVFTDDVTVLSLEILPDSGK